MGRLGFNLVREKDAAKNVENGLPPAVDAHQNERNEGAEIGELLLVCERNRRTIRSLRILSFCLAIMLMCMAAYMILTQSKQYYNDQPKTEFTNDELPEILKGALIGNGGLNYEDTSTELKQNDQGNCTRSIQELEETRDDLERKLESEREERDQFARESESRYKSLEDRFNALSADHNSLSTLEKTQSAILEQLRQERAELIQKLEASQRKLQRSANQRAAARSASAAATIKPSTTTPAPHRPNIFDTEQFKKINDLVKDIETGAAIFDLGSFLRKTDEIFNP